MSQRRPAPMISLSPPPDHDRLAALVFSFVLGFVSVLCGVVALVRS